MKIAQTLEGVTHTHTHTHVYSLQNKIVLNYIKNVVGLMSLKLNNMKNKDSNNVQNRCA